MPNETERRGRARPGRTANAFVELLDTLVGDFDVIDVHTALSSQCVDLLGVAEAGILLVDANGQLAVTGASNEQVNELELVQVTSEQGPCLDCYNSGQVVINADLRSGSPWPLFAAEAVAAGLPSVCAIPLRMKQVVLGCLNLFMSEPVRLSDADVALARALADMASIAIVQDHALRESAVRQEQLQHALTSRIVVEQAKGIVAERTGVDMERAFSDLRGYARTNNQRLSDVAGQVVAGTLAVEALTRSKRPSRQK